MPGWLKLKSDFRNTELEMFCLFPEKMSSAESKHDFFRPQKATSLQKFPRCRPGDLTRRDVPTSTAILTSGKTGSKKGGTRPPGAFKACAERPLHQKPAASFVGNPIPSL
jgi:hypothetical protein